jgi:hypothetical protein
VALGECKILGSLTDGEDGKCRVVPGSKFYHVSKVPNFCISALDISYQTRKLEKLAWGEETLVFSTLEFLQVLQATLAFVGFDVKIHKYRTDKAEPLVLTLKTRRLPQLELSHKLAKFQSV